ncbi:MAG: hypothetical protein KVP17_001961 [Porospora cf. gigantea B]|uniref:uncharacterized protein n=1 Tax=Porospora cf. gigantea B TaxID=2853592 RepID=UPI003571952E|nr:MAG: hypothetical protein KVP17_001961 [Porospora cf. gigantea B]
MRTFEVRSWPGWRPAPVPFNLWNQKTPPQPDEQTLHSAQAHFEAEATRDAVCLQELTRALDLSMNRLRTVYDGEDVCHRYDDLSECRQRNSYNKQIREAQLNLIREPFDSNLTLLCNARIHSATTLQRLNAKLHFLKRKLTSVPLGVEALGVEEQISQVLTEMEIELGRAISEERAINGSMNNV